ncbi:MAG TPA: FKBP-type peptidyl-prolyl cis-trans isomerase [Nocardioidaceae bacterium]|nr:FKBP-type peptidyl-prolyl cis-trans isomerase [Nocardioidaceae bacterium]
MRRLLTLLVASLLLLATAACGSGSGKASPKATGSSDTSGGGGGIPGLSVNGKVGSQPQVKIKTPLKVSTLRSDVVSAGSGPQVHSGDQVQVNLYLASGATGKKLQSTYDTGQAQTLVVSQSQQTNPLVEKTLGQREGSRLVLADKASDIFGPNGVGSLKPTDTAVIVVDIMSVQTPLTGPKGTKVPEPAGLPRLVQHGSDVTGLDWSHTPKKPPTTLRVVPLVKGTGATVKKGQQVTVDYYGSVWGADKAFDSSFARGTPASFKVGVGSLIKAWDQKIPGLKVGSRVLIVAPPAQAYGSQAQQAIPANSTLVFVVDILGAGS